MSHESVWYSRPRTYGKGSREWYVLNSRYLYRRAPIIYALGEGHAHRVGLAREGDWTDLDATGMVLGPDC